jgi:hypothetical protein
LRRSSGKKVVIAGELRSDLPFSSPANHTFVGFRLTLISSSLPSDSSVQTRAGMRKKLHCAAARFWFTVQIAA